MALEVTNLVREFKLQKSDGKTVDLKDPDPNMPPSEVVKFHTSNHPELNNGILEGPVVVNDKAVFTIKTKAGKLG